MLTKEDKQYLEGRFATKEDLSRFATKDDLERLRAIVISQHAVVMRHLLDTREQIGELRRGQDRIKEGLRQAAS